MIFGENKRRSAFVCLVVFLIMMNCYIQGCFAADASDASQAIGQAEQDLCEAYVRVVDADAAGADVSELSNELNVAGAYLSSANAAFNAGDYDAAIAFATDCRNSVKGISSEAENLESYAKGESSNALFSAIFVSVFGVVFVIIFGYVGWEFLKRRQFRRILNKKPVAVDFCEF